MEILTVWKSQYKNVGFGQNKHVGFSTFLFDLFPTFLFYPLHRPKFAISIRPNDNIMILKITNNFNLIENGSPSKSY